MRSLSTAEFRKTKTCPSAQILLLYHEASLTQTRRRRVAAHLSGCDFCGAEMQLLTAHRPAALAAQAATPDARPIPAALRRLAEDLLSQPVRALAIFAEISFDREPLTLTDA
jgi:anti-sigma factor RsiW